MAEDIKIAGTHYKYDESLQKRLSDLDEQIRAMWQDGQLDAQKLTQIYLQSKTEELYHSNRIEGNTLTLGETKMVVEEGGEISSKPKRHQLEARNLSTALEFVQVKAMSSEYPVTQTELRQIHELVLQNVQDDAGEYRTTQNYVEGSKHSTPDAFVVPQQMMELSDYLKSRTEKESTRAESPLVTAVVAHTWLVRIHPFTDGNGRTARALLSLILMRNGYLPCIITEDDRDRYIDAVEFSHVNLDLTPLIELVCENVEESTNNLNWLANAVARLESVEVQHSHEEFKIWHNAMDLLKIQFMHTVDNFNAAKGYGTADWKFANYGPLDIKKYVTLRDGGRVKKTWYFGVELNSRRVRSRYVFFFASSLGGMSGRSPVVLVIAKNTADGYQSLYNLSSRGESVPDIFQIGFTMDSRKFLTNGKAGVRERNLANVVKLFFNQVVERDFGT